MSKDLTAMQDLKQDLIFTIDSAKEALKEIENPDIRLACQEVVRITLRNIIKRIDDELLELERQQIINSHYRGYRSFIGTTEISEQYYNKTFKKIRYE
jgi:hypothetical protein